MAIERLEFLKILEDSYSAYYNIVPPEEAQALLRHAQLSTTMDIYTDLREAKLKKIHEKVYSVDIE